MGIFADQADRLQRESWSSPDELAQELYAIFTSSDPVTIDSPLTVTSPPGSTVPPLTLENFGSSPETISLSSTPQPPIQLGNLPPLPPPGDIGGITLTNIYPDGSGESWQGDPLKPPATTPGTGSPAASGGFPGQVLSGGPGPGPYKVALYTNTLTKPAKTVSATQLSIASEVSIPAGTWTIVTQLGNKYYMQVPVWGTSQS